MTILCGKFVFLALSENNGVPEKKVQKNGTAKKKNAGNLFSVF